MKRYTIKFPVSSTESEMIFKHCKDLFTENYEMQANGHFIVFKFEFENDTDFATTMVMIGRFIGIEAFNVI